MAALDVALIVLVVLWIGGFALSIGGNLIHLLLVAAVIVFAIRMLSGTTSIGGRHVGHHT